MGACWAAGQGPAVWSRTAMLVIWSLVAATGVSAAPPRQTLSAGTVQVVVEPHRTGLRVLCDGLELIKSSELIVTKPPWAPHYYVGPTTEAVRTATFATVEGGTQLRLTHRGENDSFEATETLTLIGDGRLEQVFEARLLKPDNEALIQWRIGALNPTLMIGLPYRAILRDGTTAAGVVPAAPVAGDVPARTLAKGFQVFEVDARIGPLKIEVDADRDLIVYDFRTDRWADPQNPYFWFGDLGSRFKTGQTVRYRIVYHLPPPAGPAETAAATAVDTPVEPAPQVQLYPRSDLPLVIPRPKEAEYGPGGYTVTAPVEAHVEGAADVGRARSALYEYLFTDFALPPQRAAPPRDKPPAHAVVFAPPDATLPAEGYRLEVTPEQVRIAAADPAGYLHAVRTLRQLTTRTPDGAVLIRAARIRDWPALSFRGIHLFTGGRGPDLHLKLIRNIIGALKLNHLVLECEYIQWDSHPEIHHPEYGMPKDDVRMILAACREENITVTPLVMTLGHCQWMFTHDQNLELAEDPDAKWAYCVTNPKTYDFIFQVFTETLELFQPRYLHIGHDEFTHRGRFPFRETSKPYTAEQLLVMDTRRLHEWLTARGVRVMMWGDMLLAKGDGPDACHAATPESAAQLREQLPKDIVIADWHYCGNPPADFVNLDRFHDAGFQTVAATWDRPANIVHFAQAAHQQKSLGLLQTTWAGYSLDPESFAKEIHQYAAYVLAADAAWNADNPPDPDDYPAQSLFFDRMGLSALRPANRSGWVADLTAACNCSLAATDASGWFGLGPDHDLSALPSGDVRFHGLAFRLAASSAAGRPSAVALHSKLTRNLKLPGAVELTLGARAAQLAILHTTSFACDDGAVVGQYVLTYADGTTAALDVIYGQNVLAYDDRAAVAAAPIVWSGRTAAGRPVALRALIWDNPRPAETVRSLTIRSANAAGALLVLGITGLDSAAPATENTSR